MENQRVRITKRMLKEALLALLAEKPLGKITVYELCQRAEVNRTTFYKYYGSPQELLDEICSECFDELESCLMGGSGDGRDCFVEALGAFAQRREQWAILFNAVDDKELASKLFSLPAITWLLRSNLDEDGSPAKDGYRRTFVLYGGYAVVRSWLNDGCTEPPELIASLITEMVLGSR